MDTLGIILAMLPLLFLCFLKRWVPSHSLYDEFTKVWHEKYAQQANKEGE